MASNRQNRFQQRQKEEQKPQVVEAPVLPTLPEPVTTDDIEVGEAPIDLGQAMLVLADGIEAPEPGRHVINVDDDGQIVFIQPYKEEERRPSSKDIVVVCPTSGKKCVAEFEVKRRTTGVVQLVCKECVGPQRENEYQRML